MIFTINLLKVQKEVEEVKKLAIIVDSLVRGGAERVSIYLASYFKCHGWDCDIITFVKRNNEYELPKNIKRYVACENGTNIVCRIKKLREKINESNPDIGLIMGTPLCTYAIPALSRLKIPFVVSERNAPAFFAGNKLNIKIARLMMKKADGFVFQTNDSKNFYDKILGGRGVVIPNPLNKNISEAYLGTRNKSISAVGRLIKQKNHKLLLSAFTEIHKSYSDYFLDIYGEGTLEFELKKMCIELNISEFVRFHGNVTDVTERIKKSAMFVMSSDFEGMPNALIEAMAVGLPCISTDCPCGGPRDLIENNVNGLLVKVNNINEMLSAIKYYIENPEAAEAHGKKAVEIRQKLDSELIGAKWMEYFEEKLSE